MTALAEAYDYVIVGAGSAGCVLAGRLSARSDVTVCLIEAGPPDRSFAIRAPQLLQFAMNDARRNWSYRTLPQPMLDGRELYWPRGKTLGGSSAINAMHYIRGAPANYDEWARDLGAQGWGWSEVLPVFTRMQHQTRGADARHGEGGPLWVQDIAPLNPLTEAFLAAGAELQLPLNPDFNGPRQEGVGVYQVTQKGGRRWSAADAFLRPAMDRPNLAVTTETLVRRIILEGPRATGVEVERAGETRLIAARRETILCGGAVNSPQLLMLSGIGEPSALRAAGVSPEIDLPGVGKGLQDHLYASARIATRSARSIGYSLRATPKLLREALRGFPVNPVQGGGFARSRSAGELPDIQLVFIPALASPHGDKVLFGHGATLHACALYPKSRGAIRLASNDPKAAPLIDPNYLASEEDMAVMIDALHLARRILAAPAFAFDRLAEEAPGSDVQSRDELARHIRANAETLYHPTSTCRMGADDLAVVDSHCRVRGAEGLRVADASVMPRLIGGNTNAPTMMIADRAADFIEAGL